MIETETIDLVRRCLPRGPRVEVEAIHDDMKWDRAVWVALSRFRPRHYILHLPSNMMQTFLLKTELIDALILKFATA